MILRNKNYYLFIINIQSMNTAQDINKTQWLYIRTWITQMQI